MFALGKSANDAEFAITGERKQQLRRFSQHSSEGKERKGEGEFFIILEGKRRNHINGKPSNAAVEDYQGTEGS